MDGGVRPPERLAPRVRINLGLLRPTSVVVRETPRGRKRLPSTAQAEHPRRGLVIVRFAPKAAKYGPAAK